jgi:phospholipid transport system substrate-binding protein
MLFNGCLMIFSLALLFCCNQGVLAANKQTLEGGTDRLFGGYMTTTSKRKFSRREIAGVLLGFLATPAFAVAGPAEGYVDKIANEVMGLANGSTKGDALRGRFAAVLNRYISLQNIANFALGPYQKKLPAGDKSKFYNLFSNYAAALFVYYVDDFKGTDLEILSTSQQGNYTVISSAILKKSGGREQVKWRLSQAGGSFRVSDINIKGVWLTIATKKRFGDVLNRSKGDFQALYDELKEAETW